MFSYLPYFSSGGAAFQAFTVILRLACDSPFLLNKESEEN